ncbi:APC family permease [Tannockella kyphosi]|uniref:APC family permease n=1 Tax=Tannockella kyphosi TaxID=2899121 RepID=UPI0020117779|nr:APC family permease [Tannockella kyphosi]
MKKQSEYNILTAISMIIGIVIGSGIFFKSDDVLNYTNGSVALGILVFVIAGISIIFGSLTIAQIAIRTDKAGGIVTYMEEVGNTSLAGSLGWFHTFIYYPTLIVVVSWVAGVYFCLLFGMEGTLLHQCSIGFTFTIFFFIMNIISKRMGGYFQVATTIIKLIPLFLIAVLGLMFGETSNITLEPVIATTSSMGFIAAIVPIAFSFDGWIIATSMSHEIKNSKKNLPIALIISPLFIVCIYSLYLVGISALLGADQVIALGDSHVDVACNMLFGANGAKIMLVFIVISVLGTVNGLILGAIRLPYGLALRNMLPGSNKLKEVNETYDIPVNSALLSFGLAVGWYIVHYLVMNYALMGGSDISEIAIVMNYVCYILLYLGVIGLYRKKEITSFKTGVINPVLATIGSLIIFAGSLIVFGEDGLSLNIKVLVFMGVSLAVLVTAYLYCNKQAE